MFGAGLNAQELKTLIERDLHLQVKKTWLDQLHKGTATTLPERLTSKDPPAPSTTTPVPNQGSNCSINITNLAPADDGSVGGDVNVFINVISKEKPLQQPNWTRARVFAPTDKQQASRNVRSLQQPFTIPTLVSSNNEWNLAVEAYIREVIESEDANPKTKSSAPELRPDYSRFQPVLESEDLANTHSDSHRENDESRDDVNKRIIEKVLEIIYPATLRYKIVSRPDDTEENQEPTYQIVAMDTPPITSADKIPNRPPTNIASATVIIESESAHYCLSPHRYGGATGLTTLQDMLRFNPGNLDTPLKKGFLVYQLLKAVKGLHENGLIHGSLKPSNVYIDENLWITLAGIKCSVPCQDFAAMTTGDPVRRDDAIAIPKGIQEESIVMKWAKGEISNFTYLMILNNAAGRRQGDPNVHPIFPWVADFTGNEVSDGWRDFSKTKFRLNKGDEQLDVTFDGPIPHHITDILSDITYYVYMARQIPIPVLCQFVRSKYEANEYPSSIRRLYEWTPDECIPEFYTDPSIFKSIHADMLDMSLPLWAKTPEDFIRLHREALESDHVSQHLHEWIDLTFGYKLSGPDAVVAKNVALSLFPGQSSSMKHGIIQLFTDPHPQRVCNWSAAKMNFLKAQSEKHTALERASRITKRRSFYRPQNDRQQFVEKVSDLLFRPTGPTRSKSMRHQTVSSRPSSLVIIHHDRDSPSGIQGHMSPTAAALISPVSSISQDTSLAMATTRPEALVQLIQSEQIELPREFQDAIFTDELDHFENTYHFGSKYHFMDSSEARACAHASLQGRDLMGSTVNDDDSFQYMQSWDVYCLGEIFKQIYLAEEVPNNSINMALKPDITVEELTRFQLIPVSVSKTISEMLNGNWRERPKIEEILQKSIPALSPQTTSISKFVPGVITEIYDFLAMFYVCSGCAQIDLANKWIDKICALEDDTFEIALPVFVHLFSNDETRLSTLSLLPKLGQRLGIKRAKASLLKPILSLFESTRPMLPPELLKPEVISELLRRFGTSTFLKQLFPYYIDSLTADYGSTEVASEDYSTTPSSSMIVDNSAVSTLAAVLSETEPQKKSVPERVPKQAKVVGEAFVGLCRSIGPILTSKHVMRPFSRLAYKDPVSLALLRETLGGIANEFGSTFALVQFSHLMHLMESTSGSITARSSITLKNLLGMLRALVPHIYDTQLVTELKNGGSDLIYRLMDPSTGKRTSRSDALVAARLSVSRYALDFILQISFSLIRADWEKHVAPILQKYFSGFGPDTDETNAKPFTTMEVQRNEQMMYAYGQLCSCVGQDVMQSMIPASDAIERLIAAKLASREFGNSPLRSLGSITAQGKFVLTPSSSTFWQKQRSQQAKDLANSKRSPFTTKDLWSATSAGMSKALSLFDSSKSKSSPAMVGAGGGHINGGNGYHSITSASSALASVSASTSSNTIGVSSSSTTLTLSGLNIVSKDTSPQIGSVGSNGGQESTKSPTEVLSTGSLSPVLGSAPARKGRQNFGSPGRAKTAARLELLSNWNRFLSTNQEEMAKSMQFAFNDWKLQGFEGHASGIRAIGANEYQRVLATGSKDRTVKLWSLDIHRTIENPDYADAGSGCLMTYNGHRRGAVYDIHFATGGGSFGTGDIVASCDGQIHLWEPETGKTVHQFSTGKNPVMSMVPIYRSQYIVAGLADSTLAFLDTHTHANMHSWRSTSSIGATIRTVATNPAENLIATAFSNGTVSLLESRTGTLVGQWRASDNEITQMRFYTNDILITSAPADHTVCVWSVPKQTLIKLIRGTSDIVSLEIFKDEIITMHHNNSISFTPINDDSLAYTSKFKSSAIRSSISCISILPMNQLLVLGCLEGDLYLYS